MSKQALFNFTAEKPIKDHLTRLKEQSIEAIEDQNTDVPFTNSDPPFTSRIPITQ